MKTIVTRIQRTTPKFINFRCSSGLSHNECTPEDIIKKDKDYILGLYGRSDTVFTHGQGAYLFTPQGKKYLDFYSGIAVTSIGHSDPEWVAAVQDQVGKLVTILFIPSFLSLNC